MHVSTCAGAPAPHRDCPHGERCDWTPKPGLRSYLRARQVRTPERALATIHKLETADLEELGTKVYVWPEARGRVTGFFVGCEEHGGMPFLAPSKAKAHVAAARHIVAEHRKKGTVVLRDRPLALEVS